MLAALAGIQMPDQPRLFLRGKATLQQFPESRGIWTGWLSPHEALLTVGSLVLLHLLDLFPQPSQYATLGDVNGAGGHPEPLAHSFGVLALDGSQPERLPGFL